MKALWIVMAIAAAVDLFCIWCCCQVAGRYDEQEASYLDVEWNFAEK